MGQPAALRCISCGKEYDPSQIDYTCPTCGPRRGTLEVLYDYDRLKKQLSRTTFAESGLESMWRYLPLLPVVQPEFIQPLRVGWTPAYRFPVLAERLGLKELFVKDDGQNPTASYKDRASSIVVIKAQEREREVVTCASTGNAASSLAGFSASTSLRTMIFVPKRAPEAKVAQLLIYGAQVFLVDGSYDDAYDLAAQAADAFGWYNRSAAVNPYLVEGKKTGALELAEQTNWNPPDAVFVGVGDGSVISGLCKGFDELARLGLIDKVPRVYGVQAEGSSPIEAAFRAYDGASDVPIHDIAAYTLADSICVGKPRDIVKAVTYVHANGGGFVTVSDEEILTALRDLAQQTGVFAEPAGAAALAGLRKAVEKHNMSFDSAAIVVSGNGLKDIASARKAVRAQAVSIRPLLEEVKRYL